MFRFSTRSILCLLFLITPLLGSDTIVLPTYEWPLSERDPSNRASTPELILPPLEPLWEYDFGDAALNLINSFIGIRGKVIVATNDPARSLAALDVQTGNLIWQHSALDINSFLAVGYDGESNRLYAATTDDILVLDPDDGSELDQFPVPNSCHYTQFTILDGDLYVVACRTLSRMDGTGDVIWSYTQQAAVGSYADFITHPAIGNGIVYAGSGTWNLRAFDMDTGELIWESPTPGAPYTPPVIGDSEVFVGCQGQYGTPTMIAYDAFSGQARWGVYADTVSTPMSYQDGVLFFGSNDARIYAVDTRIPKILWTYEMPEDVREPVIVTGNVVYAMSLIHWNLVALDAETGELLDQYLFNWWSSGLVAYQGVLLTKSIDLSGNQHVLKAVASRSGFRLSSIKPDSSTVMPGEQARFHLDSYATHGFTETLQLSASAMPDGVWIEITPAEIAPFQSVTVTVTISPTVSWFGHVPITITASSMSDTQSKSTLLFIARARLYLPVVSMQN